MSKKKKGTFHIFVNQERLELCGFKVCTITCLQFAQLCLIFNSKEAAVARVFL